MSGLENSRKTKLSIWKWIVILAVGAGIFYIVYPKYYFKFGPDTFRANTITGKIETIEKDKSGKYDWVDFVDVNNQ